MKQMSTKFACIRTVLINKLRCAESNTSVTIVFGNFSKFHGGGGAAIM